MIAAWLAIGILAAADMALALVLAALGVSWWWVLAALGVALHVAWGVMAWRVFR